MTLQAGQRVTGPSSPPAVRAGDAGEGASGRDLVADRQRPVPVLRWFGLVWLTAFVVLLANQPGRMVFDTKLAVDLDPAGYFASLWHLWDPLDSFGTLHNQAVGYAVPMAPVYLAGQLAHVPVWITERLWMSLIIAAGFSGLVKLADALGIGSRNSRVLAGLVFALWPTFTIVIGSTSAAVLPGMLAPWAVLPLVKAVHPGRPGWSGPLWPAARSGAVVLLMGGVNATSTLYVLLLPGLFIVTYARGRRLVSLSLAWGAAVAAATAWWTLPLLLQGKYAFNFLPYVEQSATTTATTSAAATLRGAGNWVAYLNFGTPWLPAGWAMVTTPIAIIAAAAAAGCGLYGLSRRRMPAATWLRLSAGIAAAIALAGYSGPLGGPFHGAVQHVLDGTLAPFRNVYKLEPVIAAVLALGVAHATARWLAATPADSQPDRKALAIVSRLVLGFMLVGLAVPYLSGRILNPGSFPAVPRYWSQAAGFLAAHSPRNAALVVPADAHGEYLWGDPIDDPLEALGTSPWVAQGLVPYGGTGSQLVLQTAENAIESGEQVPGLGAYLERAGIRYVVVRNDLDRLQVGYTPPAVVHQTLALSGFTRVASFGAVEIYAVPGSGQPLSPVSTLPVSQTVLVNGGPDSLLQLAGQNLLGPGQPAIVAGNPLPGSAPGWPARWAVTDGLRRADEAFGLINSNISYTYTATENNPVDDQLGGAGGPPRQFLPVPAAGHQTVAVLSGAAQVSVSSYGSWLADTQQEDPASAFDGNPATAWTEGSATTPAGQWIQVIFDHPVELPASVGIRLLDDNPDREIASRLRVSTAAGSTTSRVTATGKTQPLRVAPGRTSWLRITIAGAERVTPGGPGAGISDVLIPGVRVTRLLQPAEDPAGQRAASVSFSFHQQVPSPVTFADPAGTAPMARTFTLPQPAALRLSATALAVPGAGLDALLDKIPPPGRGFLQVGVATAAPWSGPASLIRGSGPQPLITDSANPVIHLSWHGKRRIRSLIVQPAGGSVPQTVEIRSPAGTRQAGVGFGGLVVFKQPLTTDRLDVSFPRVQQAITVSSTGQRSTLPVELSRLSVPALAKLRPVAPRARLSLACGQGPALRIDGRAYRTAVSGTLGELSGYRPLQVRLCAPDGTLALGAGRHTLTAAPGTFAVTDLSLTEAGPDGTAGPGGAAAPGASRTVTAGTLAARPAPAHDRPRTRLLPGGARELQRRLGGHAERARAEGGLPGRLAAGLRRAGRGGRHDHAQLPPGGVVSPGPRGVAARPRRPAGPGGVVLRVQVRAGGPVRRSPGGDRAAPARGLVAGVARRDRADVHRRRPGGAGRGRGRRPGLVVAALAARAGLLRDGRRRAADRRGGAAGRGRPVRRVRRSGAGVRAGRAGGGPGAGEGQAAAGAAGCVRRSGRADLLLRLPGRARQRAHGGLAARSPGPGAAARGDHGDAGRAAAGPGPPGPGQCLAERLHLGVPAAGRPRPGFGHELAGRGGAGFGPDPFPGGRSAAGPLAAVPPAARPRARAATA